jgi:GrpB-like predicted nucleotidyltransferase (UPF0157 family)
VTDPIVVVASDPGWPARFLQLRDRLAAALGPLAIRIEHVGSTAVPGLAAKPIIDLDVVIATRDDLPAVIDRLRPLGYRHQGDLGVPGREAFASPPGSPPHHLYPCTSASAALARHLALRDLLRADPPAARAYADLKRSLAARFRHDRAAYADAKTDFIETLLAGRRQGTGLSISTTSDSSLS